MRCRAPCIEVIEMQMTQSRKFWENFWQRVATEIAGQAKVGEEGERGERF